MPTHVTFDENVFPARRDVITVPVLNLHHRFKVTFRDHRTISLFSNVTFLDVAQRQKLISHLYEQERHSR